MHASFRFIRLLTEHGYVRHKPLNQPSLQLPHANATAIGTISVAWLNMQRHVASVCAERRKGERAKVQKARFQLSGREREEGRLTYACFPVAAVDGRDKNI